MLVASNVIFHNHPVSANCVKDFSISKGTGVGQMLAGLSATFRAGGALAGVGGEIY